MATVSQNYDNSPEAAGMTRGFIYIARPLALIITLGLGTWYGRLVWLLISPD